MGWCWLSRELAGEMVLADEVALAGGALADEVTLAVEV